MTRWGYSQYQEWISPWVPVSYHLEDLGTVQRCPPHLLCVCVCVCVCRTCIFHCLGLPVKKTLSFFLYACFCKLIHAIKTFSRESNPSNLCRILVLLSQLCPGGMFTTCFSKILTVTGAAEEHASTDWWNPFTSGTIKNCQTHFCILNFVYFQPETSNYFRSNLHKK